MTDEQWKEGSRTRRELESVGKGRERGGKVRMEERVAKSNKTYVGSQRQIKLKNASVELHTSELDVYIK